MIQWGLLAYATKQGHLILQTHKYAHTPPPPMQLCYMVHGGYFYPRRVRRCIVRKPMRDETAIPYMQYRKLLEALEDMVLRSGDLKEQFEDLVTVAETVQLHPIMRRAVAVVRPGSRIYSKWGLVMVTPKCDEVKVQDYHALVGIRGLTCHRLRSATPTLNTVLPLVQQRTKTWQGQKLIIPYH
jgi:hypothetical protein